MDGQAGPPTQKDRKSNLLIRVLNWERVGERTIEEGRAFQQLTQRFTKLFARLLKVYICLISFRGWPLVLWGFELKLQNSFRIKKTTRLTQMFLIIFVFFVIVIPVDVVHHGSKSVFRPSEDLHSKLDARRKRDLHSERAGMASWVGLPPAFRWAMQDRDNVDLW